MENENKLPPEFKTPWLKALRGGEYKQGTGMLFDVDENQYCCLGVFCVANKIKLDSRGMDTEEQVDIGGYSLLNKILGKGNVEKLYTMNDCQNKTFIEIADYIEQNL